MNKALLLWIVLAILATLIGGIWAGIAVLGFWVSIGLAALALAAWEEVNGPLDWGDVFCILFFAMAAYWAHEVMHIKRGKKHGH